MGIVGWIILIIGFTFVGVTILGWDDFFRFLEALFVKFIEFIESGIVEVQERI